MRSNEMFVTINGNRVKADEGMTILEVAEENDIDIPTLCYSSELSCPIGSCRICVVEVEGQKNLVASCHTPVQSDMVIKTHSPRVIKTRKTIVELLLASHVENCLVCDSANKCELRKIAADLGVGMSRFKGKKRFYQIEDVNPHIVRDLTKCILCRRCIQICTDSENEEVLSIANRGFNTKVVHGMDESLPEDLKETYDKCIEICPVGALEKKEDRFKKKKSTPIIITG